MTRLRDPRAIVMLRAGVTVLLLSPYVTGAGVAASAKADRERGGTDALHPRVTMETSMGRIVLELDAQNAPATAMHFLRYVKAGFYDGTIFHRVKKDSLIQGGGYTPDMTKKKADLADPFERRWTHALRTKRGSVALIHGTTVNGPGTAEFFISVVDNKKLDDGPTHDRFAVFGKVVEGMDVVDRIRNTPVSTHPKYAAGLLDTVPVKPIVMKSVRLTTPFDPKRAEKVAREAGRTAADRLAEIIRDYEAKYGKKFKTTDSGLRYLDIHEGGGPKPFASDTIEYQYRGTLINGTEFGNTYMTRPQIDQISDLVKGMQEGLITMNEGGERILIVPPDLAYGSGGIPGHIPPGATVIYRIELLEIK